MITIRPLTPESCQNGSFVAEFVGFDGWLALREACRQHRASSTLSSGIVNRSQLDLLNRIADDDRCIGAVAITGESVVTRDGRIIDLRFVFERNCAVANCETAIKRVVYNTYKRWNPYFVSCYVGGADDLQPAVLAALQFEYDKDVILLLGNERTPFKMKRFILTPDRFKNSEASQAFTSK